MKRDVPYPEYAPFYWITDDGRVISKETGLDVKPFNKHHGYQKVKLRANGLQKNATVARMVALAFIPTDDASKDVDHIDNDKLNNHVSNLQWLTRAENVAKSFKQGRVNPRKGQLSGKITGLYLSHEAREVLAGVENKSKFVSDLITKTPPSPKNTEPKTSDMPFPTPANEAEWEENKVYLKSEREKNISDASVMPEPTLDDRLAAGEFGCCFNENQPCKHWQWDINVAMWKNTLSGRLMDADE